MALTFSGLEDKVSCGTDASLTNMTSPTVIVWLNMPSYAATGDTIAGSDDGGTGTNSALWFNGAQYRINRATQVMIVRATAANLTGLDTTDKWVFLAFVADVAGVDGDQRIYSGDLTTPAVEASAYSLQQVGSGTQEDNSGQPFVIGNRPATDAPLNGTVALCAVWDRNLTLPEIRVQQFHPRPTSGCVGFWHVGLHGGASGTQPDWSGSGNDGTVVNSPTLARHVPVPMFADPFVVPAAPTPIDNDQLAMMGFAASGGGLLPWMW